VSRLREREDCQPRPRRRLDACPPAVQVAADAQENPVEIEDSIPVGEPLAELKKTRQALQEANPAFRVLFRCVEECINARVLQGDAFAVSTVLWTGVHGAAAILITQQDFLFGSRQRYAEEVVATLLAGAQTRAITRL